MPENDVLTDRPPHLLPEAHLKQLRKKLGMTQEELALRMGTYLTKISRYENGSPEIKFWQIPLWAEALGVSILDCLPPDWTEADEDFKLLASIKSLPERDLGAARDIVNAFAARAQSEFEAESAA